MANGDCPVGSANAANIRTLEREMAETREEVRQLTQVVQQMQVVRASLGFWSTVLVAVIAGIAAVAGQVIAAAIKAHGGN